MPNVTPDMTLAEVAFVIVLLGFLAALAAWWRQRRMVTLKTQELQEVSSEADASQDQLWVLNNLIELVRKLQATTSPAHMGSMLLAEIVPLTGSGLGVVYTLDDDQRGLNLLASFGFRDTDGTRSYRMGEGLVGQCAELRQIIDLDRVPSEYLRIHSGLGEARPGFVLIVPMMADSNLVAVLELASFSPFSVRAKELLREAVPMVGITLDRKMTAVRARLLLERTQAQAEDLRLAEEAQRLQQEELRITNEQLGEQAKRLRSSEEELRVQAEELQVSNEELRHQTGLLDARTKELEKARVTLEAKAAEVEKASRYKSEFLANMSHELRTPLNSLLILARSLADNDEGNLTADQQEAAKVILESGTNLLRLINDILDLSKVEAGKMDVHLHEMRVASLATALERQFAHVVAEKGLTFTVSGTDDLPGTLVQDQPKIAQILGNLLSNAIKFTPRGGHVSLIFAGVPGGMSCTVRDNGIGIPPDKLERIFAAFEQVDGTTSRLYGGTGLGLSIARTMSRLLGGEIAVSSIVGEGSCFVLTLPDRAGHEVAVEPAAAPARAVAPPAAPAVKRTAPPRRDKPLILIVEDDVPFAKVLAQAVRGRGADALIAEDGESALVAAKRELPTGVVLDLGLPGIDGWVVMERLRADPATAHIPIHVVSSSDEESRGVGLGAVGYLVKPVVREAIDQVLDKLLQVGGKQHRLLVIEDDQVVRRYFRALLEKQGVEVTEAADGAAGLTALAAQKFDCLVLDLGLPDMDGRSFLQRATAPGACASGDMPPIVVYSGRDLTDEEEHVLRQVTDSIVIKGEKSLERLLDEVTLFLHSLRKPVRETPAPVLPAMTPVAGASLSGRTVLVVDDDMRNVFALSRVLRARGFSVVMAEDGYKAIAQLEQNSGIDIVLMDIMMPGIDGYTTMREIRKRAQWRQLPMIAVSAKAMSGDREKCIEAGADDYLSKPIDIDRLTEMMAKYL